MTLSCDCLLWDLLFLSCCTCSSFACCMTGKAVVPHALRCALLLKFSRPKSSSGLPVYRSQLALRFPSLIVMSWSMKCLLYSFFPATTRMSMSLKSIMLTLRASDHFVSSISPPSSSACRKKSTSCFTNSLEGVRIWRSGGVFCRVFCSWNSLSELSDWRWHSLMAFVTFWRSVMVRTSRGRCRWRPGVFLSRLWRSSRYLGIRWMGRMSRLRILCCPAFLQAFSMKRARLFDDTEPPRSIESFG
mmetsp:Transcript_8661/g.21331  ORF Transcript_8661/g.21331 Transcript_8661/m.21331 type:complete len:245 (+) Transcript_8661:1280-2014(+)